MACCAAALVDHKGPCRYCPAHRVICDDDDEGDPDTDPLITFALNSQTLLRHRRRPLKPRGHLAK